MSGNNTRDERPAPATVRLVEGVGATLFVGLVAWLIGANSIPPWDGFRIRPSSNLEFAIAAILTIAAGLTCVRRLIGGSRADAELQRIVAATDDDSRDPLAAFGDIAGD